MTEDELLATFERISNWGRWGADDQLGALNLISPDVRVRAAALVTDGVSVSCGTLDPEESAMNRLPVEHRMLSDGETAVAGYGAGTDYLGMSYHGPGHTHLDALSHVFFDGRLYNGWPSSVVTAQGATKGGVSTMKDGIVTRGVLLDITEVRAVEYLRPDQPVTAAELDEAAALHDIAVGPGDALVVYVGRLRRRAAEGIASERTEEGAVQLAGLGADCLDWLHDHDISLLMSDGGNDALPGAIGRATFPIHIGAIAFLGMPLIDNATLEDLHRECLRRERSEFLLAIAPLVYPGGTGSPVNPLAVF